MATLIHAEASNSTAPTQFVASRLETYAYHRFGRGSAPPLLCLQHFTGTLDFWDPAITDPIISHPPEVARLIEQAASAAAK